MQSKTAGPRFTMFSTFCVLWLCGSHKFIKKVLFRHSSHGSCNVKIDLARELVGERSGAQCFYVQDYDITTVSA